MQAVIFDLGGVLIDFDFNRAFDAAAQLSGLSKQEIRERLFGGGDFVNYDRQALHDFEVGRITGEQFHAWVEQALGARFPYAQFCALWTSIFTRTVDENLALIPQLAQRGLKVGILSNTNCIHFDFLRARMAVLRDLEHVYASHLIQLRKPAAESFHYVLKKMEAPANASVFIDDFEPNVAAARQAGLHGIVASNPAAVRDGLAALKLL